MSIESNHHKDYTNIIRCKMKIDTIRRKLDGQKWLPTTFGKPNFIKSNELIVSMLIGMSIGEMTVIEDERYPLNGSFPKDGEVAAWLMDGNLRMMAYRGFINNEYKVYSPVISNECNGKLFSELPKYYQDKLKKTLVNVNLVRKNVPNDIKLEIRLYADKQMTLPLGDE